MPCVVGIPCRPRKRLTETMHTEKVRILELLKESILNWGAPWELVWYQHPGFLFGTLPHSQ